MNELVSIILPIYNGEKYMCESIDSIINQTYKNWELLIIDDGSIDDTARIADEYVKSDERIKYFKNEQNLRLPRTLNRGFSFSKGDYLTWTSDDNKYENDALEEMINKLKNEEADFVYASCRIIDENGKEIEYIMANSLGKKAIVGTNPVGACFMYTRRVYEKIGDYNPELVLVEDYDYWQRIFANFKTTYISDILYYYRWHSGALTSTERKEKINLALRNAILNNRHLFGKLDFIEKYFYYKGLNDCCEIIQDGMSFKRQYIFYNFVYQLFYRIPGRIKEIGLVNSFKRVISKL